MWISAKDSHGLCISCLVAKHAQPALSNPEGCPHCAKFLVKTRERRLRIAVAGKSDPCLSAQTREELMDCPQASSSWGEMMEKVSTVLPPLFEDLLAGAEDDDDDEDAILPPMQSRPPSAQDESSPSPVQTDTDLPEVCRRAAARLSIDWPSQPADKGAERDLYDGKRLTSLLPPARQFIPAVPACVIEMKRFWDKPFSHRVPVKGFSRLDVQGMEDLGMADPPPVESSVANHLNPSRRAALSSTGASLPGKTERFATSVFQKIYKSSAMAVPALHATSLLTAYQAELLEEMGHQLDSGSPTQRSGRRYVSLQI
ncbi:uncharacterized protein LOC109086203 [Cyprinus carpio]|uniref:Uncharacterized protein LOC109086203 n=1 Tax=Cyprinus carpio TaxID=7962 RepID=A0A9R0AMI0_CYPCA|nr:uncharacterized protein LOC109086203 [Cyprinus carpio]